MQGSTATRRCNIIVEGSLAEFRLWARNPQKLPGRFEDRGD
jgi:hypothetical protein